MIKTPYLATDGVIEIYEGEDFKGIALIERRNEPRGLALPGGFVEIGECVAYGDPLKKDLPNRQIFPMDTFGDDIV